MVQVIIVMVLKEKVGAEKTLLVRVIVMELKDFQITEGVVPISVAVEENMLEEQQIATTGMALEETSMQEKEKFMAQQTCQESSSVLVEEGNGMVLTPVE